ncbi:MAG: helix-turn-helix transcriptional regulator [Pseudomonadota bacterium]
MFSPTRLMMFRLRRNLTRSQLHNELILLGHRRCRAMINRWETGAVEPTATDLQFLARALRAPLDSFFEQAEPARPPAA